MNLLDREIVFQFVGYCLVKYLGKNLAEQAGNHKNQDDNNYGGGQIEKQTAAGDDCNAKAVGSHFPQA